MGCEGSERERALSDGDLPRLQGIDLTPRTVAEVMLLTDLDDDNVVRRHARDTLWTGWFADEDGVRHLVVT